MSARQPSAGERTDAYQQVTDKIIAQLEAGTVPWRKPWVAGGWPSSMSTGKRYAGVNVMLLGFTDWPSKWWGTYRQIQELGGQVRKGEQSSLVTFYKDLVRTDPDRTDPETGEPATSHIPMLRTFRVFNACQADGLPGKFMPPERPEIELNATAEQTIGAYLATGTAARLVHDVHGQAHYRPADDTIHIPPASEHTSAGRYYSTLLHELAHSTGAASRLARPAVCESGKYAGHARGLEELTAELGAAFMCGEVGAATGGTEQESAAYIASWLEAIRDDKRLVVRAASAAQKAADLVMEPSRQAAAEPQHHVVERTEAEDLAIMRAAMAHVAGRELEGAA
jgi:antirestriction protein ArdC